MVYPWLTRCLSVSVPVVDPVFVSVCTSVCTRCRPSVGTRVCTRCWPSVGPSGGCSGTGSGLSGGCSGTGSGLSGVPDGGHGATVPTRRPPIPPHYPGTPTTTTTSAHVRAPTTAKLSSSSPGSFWYQRDSRKVVHFNTSKKH